MGSRPSDADMLLGSGSSPPRIVASPARKFTIERRSVPSHGYTGLSQDIDTTPKAAFIDHVGNTRDPSPIQEGSSTETTSSLWSTIWLRKITLVAFALLYLAFAAALIGLWVSNNNQNGFRITLSSNHYSWTYGPTALLVIVLSFWRQVDYYCKLTQSWQTLQRQTPPPAAQSILLDYISPLQITSFWWALRNRHVPVAASVAGFGILKLVILGSTGLLVSTPTSISSTIPVAVTSQFGMGNVQNQSFYDVVDDSPVQTYLGVLNREVSLPPGTLDDRAFQKVDYPQNQGIEDLTVDLDVFVPRISCEIAQVNTRKVLDPGTLYAELDVPSCSVGQEDQDDLDLMGMKQNGRSRSTGSEDPAFFTYYDLWRVNCSGPMELAWVQDVDNNTRDDMRYALMVSNISSWSRTENGTTTDQTAFDLSAVICDVDYSLEHMEMLHNMVGDRVNARPASHSDVQENSTHLDGLSGVVLGEQIFTSLQSTDSISFPDEDYGSLFASVPLFYLMVQTLEGDKSLERLLDPPTLKQSAERVWNGLGAQVARQAYEEPAAVDATGQGFREEAKLRIGLVSLWGMVAGFILLAALSLTIAFTVHQDVVPQDPRTIASIAAIAVASPSLRDVFRGTGAMRTSELTAKLQSYTFQTSIRKYFTMEATPVAAESSPEIKTKTGAWIPFAAKYTMISLMLISPLVAIAMLEVLQHVSNSNQGITDVTGSEKVAEYLSQYLSAFLMLLLATTFNNFDFTVTSFAPYSILRAGNAPASRSTDFTLLGEIAPLALFKSLRHRHLSSAFSNVGGIIGSLLTIVVSGLWTVDHSVSTTANVVASSASSWDTAWLNSSASDGDAAVRFNHIQHGSAVLPLTIWEDLVFPEVVDVSNQGQVLSGSTSRNLTLTVEALRPVLTCEVAADDEVEIDFYQDEDEHDWLRLTALPQLPPECQRGGANGTNSYTNFSRLIEYYDSHYGHWAGHFYDLHMGPWDSAANTSLGEFGETSPPNPLQPDNPQGCPSIGIIFAASKGANTTHDDVSALICSQKLQSVPVSATYDGASSSAPILRKEPPPEPDEATARFLTNGTADLDAFPYRVQPHLSANLTGFPGNNNDDFGAPPFFNHLIYGPNGTAAPDMLGRENRPVLIDAVTRLYARYMVHVIDLHFRQDRTPAAESESPSASVASEPESGDVTGSSTTRASRLTVNSASKIALQAMLGALALLGAAAFALSDLRGTLPRDPCSIGSVLGFLAGSEVVDRARTRGWARAGEKEGQEEGWLYALGWWPAGGERGLRDIGGRMANDWDGSGVQTVLDGRGEVGDRRFGVDVGVPDELGFRQTRWWEVRRRIRTRGVRE